MRYAVTIAGGSGTRLWPMSRKDLPKQLIPFIHGRSLLQMTLERLEGLIPASRRYVCAAARHRAAIMAGLPGLTDEQFIGEPTGRDTLNAIALSAAVIARHDPDAVIAVFTADHLIQPIETFQAIVERGYKLAEHSDSTLVTFGIQPTVPSTGFGYLELGDSLDGGAFVVRQFREKPETEAAVQYFQAGPTRYLWNSGMFVWRASTLLDCVRRYEPGVYDQLSVIAHAWDTPERDTVLAELFPTLKKISVDYAIMEPASRDPMIQVAAIPMDLDWLDVGSWPMFARTCIHDEHGNSLAAHRHVLMDTARTLIASNEPNHLITTIGCSDMVIIHTPDATLVCRADQAEAIKELHKLVGEKYGLELL